MENKETGAEVVVRLTEQAFLPDGAYQETFDISSDDPFAATVTAALLAEVAEAHGATTSLSSGASSDRNRQFGGYSRTYEAAWERIKAQRDEGMDPTNN